MRCPRQLRQNLFLHFAEQPRLWLKLNYSSQLWFAYSTASLDGCSSAAFMWVWHFLKDESVCPRSVVDLKDSGDELMPTKCPHSFHPSNPAGQDISPASHIPLPWRSGELRADTGAKGSHVAADAARKKPLSMQPPRLRVAFCHVQSTITGLLTHSHDTSP